MSSNAPVEDPGNTETDEETVALRKKRLRRVSFADREITSVHIFNRDEDYESPPDFEKKNATPENEVLGLFKDLADSDDFRELSPDVQSEDDDEVAVERSSFLRPIGSPSPGGSSIVGSATSNDEENFFGPVSASFIRPRRLSDSAASDENHDITMDSTAFSMHFRSLAKSDSGGDIKTPTGVRLSFEDKTPAQTTTPSDPGSSMVITNYKEPVFQSSSPLDRVSGHSDSFDMSLVDEIPNKYDYGKLSPKLQAILAEGSKDLHVYSLSDYTKVKSPKGSSVPSLDDNGGSSTDQKDDIAVSRNMSAEEVSAASQPVEANGSSVATTVGENITHDDSHITNVDPIADASIDHQIRTPGQQSNVNKEHKTMVRTSVLDVEFSAMNKSTPAKSIKFSQLDLSAQHESGHHSNGDQMKETYSSQIHGSAQRHESPEAGSIYSLSAKRRHIFKDIANSSQYPSFVIASPKQTTPVLGKERIAEQVFSIPRISRATEPSPASIVKDGMRRLKLRSPLPFSSETSPVNTLDQDNSKFLQSKGVDCPSIDLEKQFSFDLKSKEQETVICLDSDDIGHLNNEMRQNKETKGHAEDGDSLNLIAMTAVSSPLFSALTQKEIQDVLTSRRLSEGTFDCRSDSLSVKLALQNGDDKDVTIPPKFVSPLIKRLDQKLSSSIEYKSSISSNSDQHYKSVNISPQQADNTVKSANPCSPSTEITERLDSFVEGKAQSSSPLLEEQSSSRSLLNVSKILRSFPSPSRDKGTEIFNQGEFREGLPEKGIETSYYRSTSMYEPGRHTKEPLSEKSPSWNDLTGSLTRKDLNDSTQSLGTKDPYSASRNYNFQTFVGKDISSPESNFIQQGRSDSQSKLNLSQSLFFKKDIESSSGWKRKKLDPVHGDGDNDGNSRGKRNPKICKHGGSDLEFMIIHSDENDRRTEKIAVDIPLKHWTDISSKFSADTKELLSPLTDKLNIRAVDRLKDIVVHLQKVKLCELLCSEIQSQKINDQCSNALNKRVSESRVLLYKIAYEKAKLKLLCIKYGKFLKIIQQLGSAVQESQNLQPICTRHRSLTSERHTQTDDLQVPSMIVSDKVAIMRHDVEALDKKIKNLTESFRTYYKRKAEPSCSEIIVLLKDHLKMKSVSRFIQQDLQLWEVDDVEKGNDHHSIALNYQGFICKRLTVNASPTSTIFISYTLNALNIMKNFPNMNALAAFSFVFDPEITKKYVGSKIFAREIQTSSSILCNVLDVFREVQLAQIEVRNVTNTKFFCPSAEQLDLELCFTDFNCGRKVSLTLDMTCLKHGIYPSENLAYQFQISNTQTLESLDQRFAAEIGAAIDHLKVGYSRIIRLCKCVMQVMQSLNR